ncbi:MAG: TRAP transporter substrate-binding protein [Bacteroidota bacterium]
MAPPPSSFLRLVFLLWLALSLGCQSDPEPEYLLRASLWANEEHTWYQAFERFGEVLEIRSNGRLKLQVYPSEQLAKELESIRLIRAEVIDMTVTASLLSNWIEIAAFCELPYLLKDSADKQALLYGPLGEEIQAAILEELGLRTIAVFERGPRHLTTNRPIRHPDDLEGLIVRVPSVPTFVTAWEALGAKPTPMAFSEVFTSLQQGTIEAQENPLDLILTAGFSEVQQYVNLTGHVMSWSYPVIGEPQFQRLPPDLQQILLEAAQEMQAYEHELFLKNEALLRQQLEDKGMQFVEVDKAAFAERCEQAIFQGLQADNQARYRAFLQSRKETP